MSLESVFKLSLVMNMIDNLSGPMNGVASKVGASVEKLDALSETFGNIAKAGAVMQETGRKIVGAVLAPVEATFETRRALGELASLGIKDLGTIEDAARSFSDQWAGTTKSDFISAAYDIKSGIASLTDEGVAEYTSLAGLTAKATKSTIGEMTSLFATGYGIYKNFYADLSDIEFGKMFSAGISQSVKQFKTTGSEMASAIQSLGASATNANVPLEEQLSILGMLQSTMSGSEAGTKYAAFIRSAAKAGEALELSFLDANNQLRSMPEILDQLRGRYGETIDAVEKQQIAEAFGSDEAVKVIDLMYGKIGDLQTNIVGMYDALGSGTSVALEMASAINETEPERYERLHQRIQNITESIGNSLLPTVNDFLGVGEQVLSKVGSWVDQNQELVRGIMLLILAVGGFLAVGGTLVVVIGGIGLIITKTIAGFKMLKAGFLLAKGALVPLISTVWSFTAALLANPITWIVIGIIALIAAIVLLYNKCTWFRKAVDSILNFFKKKLNAAFETTKKIFKSIGSTIQTVMSAAKKTVEEKLSNIQTAYKSHGGGIKGAAAAMMEGVKSIYTAGYTFLDNLTGGKLTEIKNKFSEKLAPIKDIVSNVMEAAKATASEKLSNMKDAYESHGGGIKGVVAATMEGVKGYYTAGYTFIDNLTNGKLSDVVSHFKDKLSNVASIVKEKFDTVKSTVDNAISSVKNYISNGLSAAYNTVSTILGNIKSKFSSIMESAKNTVSSAVTAIKGFFNFSWSLPSLGTSILETAKTTVRNAVNYIKGLFNFSWSLPHIKTPHFYISGYKTILGAKIPQIGVSWYKNGGILDGAQIFGAAGGKLLGGGEAGKEAVLPLSLLWTKMRAIVSDLLNNFCRNGLPQTKITIEREPTKKVVMRSGNDQSSSSNEKDRNSSDTKRGVNIQKFVMQVDLKKIKDLQQLLALLQEIEDYTNGNGDEDPSDDWDAVPDPA